MDEEGQWSFANPRNIASINFLLVLFFLNMSLIKLFFFLLISSDSWKALGHDLVMHLNG